jgi:osmotically-inducible protein OsmY
MLVTESPPHSREWPAVPPPTGNVAERAEGRLRAHCNFALQNVSCEYREGVLTLRGFLPTYYLKQAAQAAVGQLDGVQRVVNEIEVLPAVRRFICPS